MKKKFVVGCFNVRLYEERSFLHEDCVDREKCTHFNFTSESDLIPVFEAYMSAWYVLHPVGDFLIRSSLYETWMASAIHAIFHDDYMGYVPFIDMLDYKKLVMHIPHHAIEGEGRENAIDLLERGFSKSRALKQIEYIHKVKNVFRYMLNPAHELIRWNTRTMLDPQDDTFTFTVKIVLRHICNKNISHRSFLEYVTQSCSRCRRSCNYVGVRHVCCHLLPLRRMD